MSLVTWRKKYYPVPASERMGPVRAVQHALRKWSGLRPAALAAHAVYKVGGAVRSYTDVCSFWVADRTCSLCLRYFDSIPARHCAKCPLAQYLGRRCDRDGGPYHVWVITGDPEPMIAALTGTLAMLRQRRGRRKATVRK